jgi:hypothetical protein
MSRLWKLAGIALAAGLMSLGAAHAQPREFRDHPPPRRHYYHPRHHYHRPPPPPFRR